VQACGHVDVLSAIYPPAYPCQAHPQSFSASIRSTETKRTLSVAEQLRIFYPAYGFGYETCTYLPQSFTTTRVFIYFAV
jgi:hypothetical protein